MLYRFLCETFLKFILSFSLFLVMGFLLSKQHRWSCARTSVSGTTIPCSKLQSSTAWSFVALGWWNTAQSSVRQRKDYWRPSSGTSYYPFLSGMMPKFFTLLPITKFNMFLQTKYLIWHPTYPVYFHDKCINKIIIFNYCFLLLCLQEMWHFIQPFIIHHITHL